MSSIKLILLSSSTRARTHTYTLSLSLSLSSITLFSIWHQTLIDFLIESRSIMAQLFNNLQKHRTSHCVSYYILHHWISLKILRQHICEKSWVCLESRIFWKLQLPMDEGRKLGERKRGSGNFPDREGSRIAVRPVRTSCDSSKHENL